MVRKKWNVLMPADGTGTIQPEDPLRWGIGVAPEAPEPTAQSVALPKRSFNASSPVPAIPSPVNPQHNTDSTTHPKANGDLNDRSGAGCLALCMQAVASRHESLPHW